MHTFSEVFHKLIYFNMKGGLGGRGGGVVKGGGGREREGRGGGFIHSYIHSFIHLLNVCF